MNNYLPKLKLNNSGSLVLFLISCCVFLSGMVTVLGVLFAQAHFHSERLVEADASITLFVGLTFIYLATLLRRGKHTAWLIALPLYIFIVIRNLRHFLYDIPVNVHDKSLIILNLAIPVVALVGLLVGQKYFRVRSQSSNFGPATIRALLVLVVAFLYGLLGFQLLDHHDFHQEISVWRGAHYTIDQFNLTTVAQPHAYTRRAHLFLDSLSIISGGAIFYVVVALFSPIRFRLSDQRHNRERLQKLLNTHRASSEDFFKLWPHDKAYFFSQSQNSCLAYKVASGVAMAIGDPAGKRSEFKKLIEEFINYCHVNDWLPALIHTEEQYSDLYKDLGFSVQKIGEEAIVDIADFKQNVANNKYFRNITNRFSKANFNVEIYNPPHQKSLLRKLRRISDEWLEAPGRAERTMMMGYFDEHYLQQCTLFVAVDENQKMHAFINQVPSFDKEEANFDFLRSLKNAPSNVNDFLMLNFIDHVHQEGYRRLNMGLSALSGIKKADAPNGEVTLLDNALQLVYTAGGRFYSFAGLKRFKAKYEPVWHDRYVVYKGGLRGFSKTMNALLKAMKR